MAVAFNGRVCDVSAGPPILIATPFLPGTESAGWRRVPAASVRNGAESLDLTGRAVQLSGRREATALGVLAAAYAEVGEFAKAIDAARAARSPKSPF